MRAELLVHTFSGIVYLGHLYAGESGQFRPLIFLGPVRYGAVFRRTAKTYITDGIIIVNVDMLYLLLDLATNCAISNDGETRVTGS